MTVPYMAVHSMNHSCVSIMYMISSAAVRTTRTMTLGSLPRSMPRAASDRSSDRASLTGPIVGRIWYEYEK